MKKKLEALLQKELDPQSKIFVISPHLDDSVFSLGGLINLLKEYAKTVVINVFSKSNYSYDKEINPEIATRIRKNEDQLALMELGIDEIINLDFNEALLRGYSRKDIFINSGDINEFSLITDITSSLKEIIDQSSLVIAPAAFGSHIDHLICREAIKYTNNVLFYEDLPYVVRSVRNNYAIDFLKTGKRITISLNEDSLEKHLKASLIYKSQILDRQYLEIKEFISKKGISLWQK